MRGNYNHFRGSRPFQGRGRLGRGHMSRDFDRPVTNTLNFKVGEKSSAVKLTRWLLKARDVIAVKYNKFGLNNIITRDGTIGNYDSPVEPDEPDDGATEIEKVKWKAKYSAFIKDDEEFKSMKLACMADIFMLIGSDSRVRLDDQNKRLAVPDRYNLDDPVDILKLIVSTHLTDTHVSDGVNLSHAETAYTTIRMYPEETLSDYKQRYTILEATYRILLLEYDYTDEEVLVKLGMSKEKALRFVLGLDSQRFKIHTDKYVTGDKPYPFSVEEAYDQALTFSQAKDRTQSNVQRRGIFLTHATNRNSNSNSNSNQNQRCNRCGANGHFQNTCRNVLPAARGGRNDSGRGRGRNDSRGRGGGGRGRNNAANVSNDGVAGGGAAGSGASPN